MSSSADAITIREEPGPRSAAQATRQSLGAAGSALPNNTGAGGVNESGRVARTGNDNVGSDVHSNVDYGDDASGTPPQDKSETGTGVGHGTDNGGGSLHKILPPGISLLWRGKGEKGSEEPHGSSSHQPQQLSSSAPSFLHALPYTQTLSQSPPASVSHHSHLRPHFQESNQSTRSQHASSQQRHSRSFNSAITRKRSLSDPERSNAIYAENLIRSPRESFTHGVSHGYGNETITPSRPPLHITGSTVEGNGEGRLSRGVSVVGNGERDERHSRAMSGGMGNGDGRHSKAIDGSSERTQSGMDWDSGKDEKLFVKAATVGERLKPTLKTAIKERDKTAIRARFTSWSLNIAIALQILLGALTTGIAAALSGRQTQIGISILGGLSTLVASYLAKARSSGEPELSTSRKKDLDQFIRECDAFIMDHGHTVGLSKDIELNKFRNRYEELMGNASGKRKLMPPV